MCRSVISKRPLNCVIKSMLRNKSIFYFGFLWFGVISSYIYGAIYICTEAEFANNIFILLTILLLFTISGIAHLTIILDAWCSYRFKVFIFIIFYPFPILFEISIFLAIIVFLFCRTLEAYKAGSFESE